MQVAAQGFDGIYLDKVDIYDDWEEQGFETAAQQMVDFVSEISQLARQQQPRPLLVYVQNAEELLKKRGYLAAIDGIAKEDLFYGQDGDEKPTPASDCQHSCELLQLARRWNKPVLTVDYVRKKGMQEDVFRRSLAQGFIPLCASSRDLDRRTKLKYPTQSYVTPVQQVRSCYVVWSDGLCSRLELRDADGRFLRIEHKEQNKEAASDVFNNKSM